MQAAVETYKFTVDEFMKIYEAGIFDEDDRIELLEGELIIMHAIGRRHAQTVSNLNAYFMEQSNRRFMLSPQNPVFIEEHSLPQPDIVLIPWLNRRRDHPKSDEVFLVAEVADSSLNYDRRRKLPLYARFGVQEFWLFNLVDDVVESFRNPDGAIYRDVRVWRRGERIAPQAFPDVFIDVDETIPEPFEELPL